MIVYLPMVQLLIRTFNNPTAEAYKVTDFSAAFATGGSDCSKMARKSRTI